MCPSFILFLFSFNRSFVGLEYYIESMIDFIIFSVFLILCSLKLRCTFLEVDHLSIVLLFSSFFFFFCNLLWQINCLKIYIYHGFGDFFGYLILVQTWYIVSLRCVPKGLFMRMKMMAGWELLFRNRNDSLLFKMLLEVSWKNLRCVNWRRRWNLYFE